MTRFPKYFRTIFSSLLLKIVDVIIAGKQLNKSVFGAGWNSRLAVKSASVKRTIWC